MKRNIKTITKTVKSGGPRNNKTGVARKAIVAALAAFGIMTFSGERADAIPYFARKYEMSCNTCHWQQPKLNNFGRWFQAKGYRMTDEEPADAQIKELKSWPISVKIETWAQAKNTGASSSDFQLHSIELQSAGSLPGGGSYFFEKYLEERGGSASAGDVLVRFPLGKSGYFQAGQFTVLSHLPDPGRLTLSRNYVYNSRASIGGKTNSVRLRDRQRGVEIGFGNSGGTSNLSLSVFNGNSTGPEAGDVADNNDGKSVCVNGYRDFGNRLSAGGFVYAGNSAAAGTAKNNFTRTGLTLRAAPDSRWIFEAIGMAGLDRNLLNDGGATRVRSAAASFEADYLIAEGSAAYMRYGQWKTRATGYTSKNAVEWTAGYSRMLHDNLKLTSEYQATPGKGNDSFLVELELDL